MTVPRAKAHWLYRKVLRHPLLPAFLKSAVAGQEPIEAGWGLKPSGRSAIRRAGYGRLLLLEDAFVRSMRNSRAKAVYGLLADANGMHYDASAQSDLITALNSGKPTGWMRDHGLELTKVRSTMERFVETGASKYNWFPAEAEEVPDRDTGILVVDQTQGDMAIRRGGLDVTDFERMLQQAFDEAAGAPVYLRAHPDHLYRSKQTCFTRKLLDDQRLQLLPPDLSPAQCFQFVDVVVVASSLLGMEALLHGKRVITFGSPFYAGWGLTEDRGRRVPAKRQRKCSLEELFEMSYLRYCHYFDPDTHEPCGLDDILDHIELQKSMHARNRGAKVTVGFSPWKQQIAELYFESPAGCLRHTTDTDAIGNARPLLWGRRQEVPDGRKGNFSRVEDGFLRSRGLGAAFNFPYSWVVDGSGIYYDASRSSDLEKMLNAGFAQDEMAQAEGLLKHLRESRLTKYNLAGEGIYLDANQVNGRKIVLVPGQVELDASIEYGSPKIKTNGQLLKAVRESEPEAFIIYKVHPDLVAEVRHGELLPDDYKNLCDRVVTSGNIIDWLDICDEVHTMTSTTGFEALIHQVPVVTYGLPFYAGWGLTKDQLRCERRTRKLSLQELVAGALIRYPRYLNPDTREFTTALKVAQLLSSPGAEGDRRVWHLKAASLFKRFWVWLCR